MALTTVQNQMTAMGNSGASYEFVNRIINGAMVIDQRNAGASITPTNGQYSLDRWKCYVTQASKYTVQQNAGSVTPPAGFTKYLGATSSSSYAVTSSDYFIIAQAIEGLNCSDLAWGTSNAKPVTLSFWVRSSLTGTFGGAFGNALGDRSYPFSYTISSANTWTYVTITLNGDTTGTWATDNSSGMLVYFSLGTGTTSSGTAGAWTSGFYGSTTGAQSVVGTNGATWYVTGVQLEKGTTASSFTFRDYGRELLMCQRYYYQLGGNSFSNPTSTAYQLFSSGYAFNTVALDSSLPFKTTMRTVPTITSANTGVQVVATVYAVTSISDAGSTPNVAFLRVNTAGSFGAGNGGEFLSNNNAAGYVAFSAEL